MVDPTDAPDTLTTRELAVAVGVASATVEAWHAAGLLLGDRNRHPLVDIERARLILYAERRGITLEDVAAACATQGDLLGRTAEVVADDARIGQPMDHVAQQVGMDPDTLRRIWVASGLGDQDDAYEEDVQALRWMGTVLGAGLPEDALIQLIRVFADAIGRVAEAETRLFHYYVHEPLRASGLRGDELSSATSAVSDPLIGLIDPAVLYFHRKAYQRALRDDLVLHLTEATTLPGEELGEMQVTILFVDLSGFTPLTATMGDGAAARVVERFSDLVRDAADRHYGKVVKQIGDEFMLAFADPARAVAFGLAVDEVLSAEPQFPAVRMGAHTGTVLYREGDYIGTNVNIAARVTAVAQRHQLLVTDEVARAAWALEGVEIVPIGSRALKGISGEVHLFEPRRLGLRPDRSFDPVCHMELGSTSPTVSVDWGRMTILFCSQACAELFTADPERYRPHVINR